jgi:transposase InsO family protein
MDNAAYNVSALNKEILQRLGCKINLISPYHSQGNSPAERLIGSIKSLIGKMAAKHPKSWQKLLGFVLWALREVPNASTGVPPAMLVFGRVPRGPLAVLKETWCGEREFPPEVGKNAVEYLKELHENLRTAKEYAEIHAQNA